MENALLIAPIALVVYFSVLACLLLLCVYLWVRKEQRQKAQAKIHSQELEEIRAEHEARLDQMQTKHRQDVERFSAIISLEEELNRLETKRQLSVQEIEQQEQKLDELIKSKQSEIETLRTSY